MPNYNTVENPIEVHNFVIVMIHIDSRALQKNK